MQQPRFTLVLDAPGPDLVESARSQTLSADRFEVVEDAASARGEWVTFPGADDVLPADYLAAVDAFLAHDVDVDLAVASTVTWRPRRGDTVDDRPLRSLFADQVVDLDADGRHFCDDTRWAFLRRSRLVDEDLSLDLRVPARFRGGHLVARYLLSCQSPTAAFLRSARYHVRRTTPERAREERRDPALYTSAPQHGLLDLVEQALARAGSVPGWLQAQLVAWLAWYFERTDSKLPGGPPSRGEAADLFHDQVGRVIAHLDVEREVGHSLVPMAEATRFVLRHGYSGSTWREGSVSLDHRDADQHLVRAQWFHTGETPREELRVDGAPALPLHAKSIDHVHYGRALVSRRVLWVPADREVAFRLDGEEVPLVERDGAPAPASARTTPSGSLARRVARRVRDDLAARRYSGAWVLMDRVHDAADSGEILFKHLRAEHPSVNAWFVLEEGTPDWERLRDEGYADRLVAHGSSAWRTLLVNAEHLISSHADEAVTHPPQVPAAQRRWRLTFLNHGVIKDDLSAWLNRKPIETFVTSTQGELASIAGDSAYEFSSREVHLTGMPRFDRLLEVGRRFPPAARDLVLVTPTWRRGLAPESRAGTQRRDLDAELIAGSAFMQQWRAFLGDPALVEACRAHGVTLGFLPHPILQPVLDQLGLPDDVRALSYDDGDVQEYFARARVAVTDFSSVAFNEAYLERPVVYFQFDEADVLGGEHVGRGGYFDYRRDGFGPVTVTATEAAAAVVAALEHGAEPAEPYRSRIEQTFPPRDGGCSERVVQAILRSAQDRSHDTPVPTPTSETS